MRFCIFLITCCERGNMLAALSLADLQSGASRSLPGSR